MLISSPSKPIAITKRIKRRKPSASSIVLLSLRSSARTQSDATSCHTSAQKAATRTRLRRGSEKLPSLQTLSQTLHRVKRVSSLLVAASFEEQRDMDQAPKRVCIAPQQCSLTNQRPNAPQLRSEHMGAGKQKPRYHMNSVMLPFLADGSLPPSIWLSKASIASKAFAPLLF